MDVGVQLICFTLSFGYGVLIRLLFDIHFRIINTKNILFKIILDSLFSFLIVLMYVILIYKINNGVFHFYFLLSIFFGLWLSKSVKKVFFSRFLVYLKKH